MVRVELKRPDGEKICSFNFPTNASEVPYSQYCRFEDAYQAKEAWLKESEELNPASAEFKAGYIRHVSKIVQAFTGNKDVVEMALGNYLESVQDDYKADEEGLKKELKSTEHTMMTLYAAIWKCMASYRKAHFARGDFRFKYKGEKYKISSTYRDAITNQVRFESLSTAQAVEALDAVRIYKQHEENDPGKKYLFTTVLHLIACLSMKKGEAFPDTDKEIQRWVSTRVRHFEDVDMQTALNVRDFFLNTTAASRKTADTGISSSPRRQQERKQRHGQNTSAKIRRLPNG